MKFKVGSLVEWRWLGRTITGKVEKQFTAPVILDIKGKKIKRNATESNPAYLVCSVAGNKALKLGSELSKSEKIENLKLKPKLFS